MDTPYRLNNSFSQMIRHRMSHALAVGFPYSNWDIYQTVAALLPHPELNAYAILKEGGVDRVKLKKEMLLYSKGFYLLKGTREVYFNQHTNRSMLPGILQQEELIISKYRLPIISLNVMKVYSLLVNHTNAEKLPIPKLPSHEVNEHLQAFNKGTKKRLVLPQGYQFVE